MIMRLIYGSVAVPPMGEDQLNRILESSRENNAKHQISGFLLFDGDRFVQLLEGPEAAVDRLWVKLGDDPRHSNVEPMAREMVASRAFTAWSMAYVAMGNGTLKQFGGSMTGLHARELARLMRTRPSPLVTALAETLLEIFDAFDVR